MCNIPTNHECFNWTYKTAAFASVSFTFAIVNGHFGYYMSNEPDRFNRWDIELEELNRELFNFMKVSPHGGCPNVSEIPAVLWKIRKMEMRYANRKG